MRERERKIRPLNNSSNTNDINNNMHIGIVIIIYNISATISNSYIISIFITINLKNSKTQVLVSFSFDYCDKDITS